MDSLTAATGDDCLQSGPIEQAQSALTDYSPSDAPWDTRRGQADDVGMIYASAVPFERYAARMAHCAGLLRFGWVELPHAGVSVLRLREAHFCRVRHCPVCQWRRSLMWKARFYQSLPKIVQEHPKARWLYLTLTVRNCSIEHLSDTLTAMNAGWRRLLARKEFAPVLGWIRTTEVTRGKDGSAHPHFHALLMVSPSWFSGQSYVKQSRWVELWRDCMRFDYLPSVDVRVVKNHAQNGLQDVSEVLRKAVAETLKYSVKPADMTSDDEWFLELTRQTHKKRFIAAGGALKDVLKLEQESNQDLIVTEGNIQNESSSGDPLLAFNWKETERRYRRAPNADKDN